MMSLIESAKLHGHKPWALLKNLFGRLPTLTNGDLAKLLPNSRPDTSIVKSGVPGAGAIA